MKGSIFYFNALSLIHMPRWQLQQRCFFLKTKRRRLEGEEDESYQMLVKGNSEYSNGNSQHIKAEITTIAAIFENVKQRKERASDKQRDVEKLCGPGCVRTTMMGFQIRNAFNFFKTEVPII